MPKPIKKHSLFPIAYDEVSLVDEGAAGSADVLIMKRKNPLVVTKAGGKVKRDSKGLKLPDNKKRKSSGRSTENPCSTKTNSTGAKTGNSSNRAKNWKEERHQRAGGGKFGTSSSDSKSKYGKGGTTKSKLDAACRSNKKKTPSGNFKVVSGTKPIKPKFETSTSTRRKGVSKSAMSLITGKNKLNEIMEGKAT